MIQRRMWFRFYADILDDLRFQMLPEVMQRRLIMLMCMRPRFTRRALNDDHVAWYLRLTMKTTLKTKAFLMEAGFLDAGWHVLLWKDRQTDERIGGKDWEEVRERVFERDNRTCVYCGATGVPLHCDHVIPISRGGTNDESNLATACQACNNSKHAKTPEQWLPATDDTDEV